MRKAATPTFDFYILILLSAVIATMGLLLGSSAVIIGAMLVAPLMEPILAVAMSMVLADFRTMWAAAEATIKGITLAIIVGAIMVIISPITELNSAILSRTAPNMLDLVIALASGAAAGYAIARKELAAALPGVAIAAALVPPLCVVGLGVGTAQLDIASGALLLFITNLVAIVFAAALTFLTLGFRPAEADRGELLEGLRITVVLLLIIFAILAQTTIVTVRQQNRERNIKELLDQGALAESTYIENVEVLPKGDGFVLRARIINYADSQLTVEDITELERDLSDVVGGPVVVQATIVNAARTELTLPQLERQMLLTQAFTEMIESQSAQVVNVDVGVNIDGGDGYSIGATVIVYQDSQLSEETLGSMQEELGQLVEAPVWIDATLVEGRQIELENPDL
jgi:uncharacterized hydrophobic protein (TIGR00271 family)